MDPLVEDFMKATQGHPVILDFSTIPEWTFKTPKPFAYPDNPNQVDWNYEQGTEFRDPTLKQPGDYYARVASWYMRGGFKDEYGKWHESGCHFHVKYWEVLNEVDLEHRMTPQQYTACYDAIVEAVRRVAPKMKFVGAFLALPTESPEFFEYFLNHKNHKPGIPLNVVSYHFYAIPTLDQRLRDMQFTIFAQADKFLDTVRYIQSIRRRLSPHTITVVNELGIILPSDFTQGSAANEPQTVKPTSPGYRELYGAMYAYYYAELTRLGVQIVEESQLVGQPGQFPSVSMVNWKRGWPNTTYWDLKLIRDNFGPGDKLVNAAVVTPPEPIVVKPYIYASGFIKKDGIRKILFVNKRDRTFQVSISGAAGARVEMVDEATGSNPPATSVMRSDALTLGRFGVAVVTLSK